MTNEEYIKRSDLDSTVFRLNFEEKGWDITRGEYKLIDSVLFEMPTYFVPEGEYVKREDVLKIVRDMRDLARADVLKNAITKIEELPTLFAPERRQGEWIPISERLPKIADVYRVTRYYPNNVMNPKYIVDACAFDGSNTWYDDNRINHERAYVNNVIAWQENPEPYREESEE